MIRSFSDARRSDIANERMPQFDYTAPSALPVVPVPSMRIPGLGLAAGDGLGASDRRTVAEHIKRLLEEEGVAEGGVAERLAERLTSRGGQVRPATLKRFETAP